MTIRVSVDQIEQIFKLLIQQIKDYGIDFVEVETDYYWLVSTKEWDDFTSTSTPLVVGSLLDDWLSLQKILTTEQVTCLDLERFASILRAVSETIYPSKNKSIEDDK